MIKNGSLLPADDGVAAQALTRVQTATTRVKTTITECIYNGLPVEETTKRLNTVIAEECKKISDPALREQTRKALVTAARKWHYQLKQNYKILNEDLKRKSAAMGEDYTSFLSSSPKQYDVEFRKILDDGTSPAVPLIKDYQRSVKIALKALSAEPAKVVTRSNGSTYVMPLRNRAEMAVRYAANAESLQELISAGYSFAWTSSHPNCSPRCKDFQGRLWSLHGETGEIDGIHYDPIEDALKGKYGDGNGIISGYNCRHRLIGYVKGSRAPKDYSEAEIKREYAIDRQQRSYENRIRQMKTEERVLRAAGKDKEAAALRKGWRRLTLDYEIYSEKNNRAFFPYRCVIDETEVDEAEKIKQAKTLTNESESSKISLAEDFTMRVIFSQEDIPQKSLKQREIRTQQDKHLFNCEKEIQNKIYEEAYVITEDGKIYSDTSALSYGISFNLKADILKKSTVTHNHPNGHCFSLTDINGMQKYEIQELRAVNPNGMVHVLKKNNERQDYNGFIDAWKNAIKQCQLIFNEMLKSKLKENKLSISDIDKQEIKVLYAKYEELAKIKFLSENSETYGFKFEVIYEQRNN